MSRGGSRDLGQSPGDVWGQLCGVCGDEAQQGRSAVALPGPADRVQALDRAGPVGGVEDAVGVQGGPGILMVSGLWMLWMYQLQNLAGTFITPV